MLSGISGQRAYPYLLELVTPPAWVVVDGDPYLEQGSRFGHYRARFEVQFYTLTSVNSVGTADMDAELLGAIEALILANWDIERVEVTGLKSGTSDVLGVVLTVSAETALTQ